MLSDAGMLTSVLQGWSVNATSALLLQAMRWDNRTDGTLSGAMGVVTAVFSTVASIVAQRPPLLVNATVGGLSEFSLTLNGPTRLILRTATNQGRAFAQGTTATLGAAACIVHGVSDLGDMLLLTTPPTAAVCPTAAAAGVECGHALLVLNTTAAAAQSASLAVSGAVTAGDTQSGAVLACPPFCPGAVGEAATVVASGGYGPVLLDSGSLDVGWIPPRSALGSSVLSVAAAAAPFSSESSLGIYYALQCFQTGAYTDPATGECGRTDSPASYRCAFGSGDACRLCPSNALCPGGSRMWPRAGAWSASESSGNVLPCSPPDAQTRCLRWNVTIGATQCGVGYLQGSYLCGSCDAAFYGDSDGACRPCPVLTTSWQRYSGIVYIAVGLIALVAAVWAALLIMVRLRGGTLVGGARHMLAFAVWALQAAQVVSNAGAVTAASLPPLIRRLYSAVAALQLEGVLLPPACTGAYPFEQEASLMALALSCWGGAVVAYYCSPGCMMGFPSPAQALSLRHVGRILLIGALVLFSPVSHMAVELLVCDSVSMAPAGVQRLNGGSSLVASASPGASLQVSTLVSNPFFVCWARDGAHRPIGILAVVTLVAYVIALPALTLRWALVDRGLRAPIAPGAEKGRQSFLGRLRALSRAFQRRPDDATVLNIATTHNPMARCATHQLETPAGSPSHRGSSASIASPPVRVDPIVAPLVSDFTPDAFYTKWVDLGLLLLLSLLRALMPRPATVVSIVLKASIACAGILAVALHVAVVRPFPRRDSWKGWVRFFLLLDAAGCVAMNAAVSLQDYGLSSRAMDDAVRGGAFALFAACVLTLTVLMGGVLLSAYLGLVDEVAAKSAASLAAVNRLLSKSAALAMSAADPDTSVASRAAAGYVHVALADAALAGGDASASATQKMRDATAPCAARRTSERRPASSSSSAKSRRAAKHLLALEHQLQMSIEAGGVPLDAVSRVGAALRSHNVDSKAAAAAARPLVAVLRGSPADSEVWAAACDALAAAAAIESSSIGSAAAAAATVTEALVQAGAAPALLEVMLRSVSSASDLSGSQRGGAAQQVASAALAQLAHTPLGAASIVSSGGLGPLTDQLARQDASLESLAAACDTLAALAMHHDDPAHTAAVASAGTMEAVAVALVRLAASAGPPLSALEAAGQSSVSVRPTADGAALLAYAWGPSTRAAVASAAAVVTNATVDEGALARFLSAGGLAPLLALLASASARGDSALVCSVATALCSVAVSTRGAASLAKSGAEVLLDALAAEASCPEPSPLTLEPLCWSLQGVARSLQQSAAVDADPVARGAMVTLARRGLPLLRRLLQGALPVAPPAVAAGGAPAENAAARARALLESLEGVPVC